MQFGINKYENTVFNSRLQPTQIGLGTTTTGTSLLKLNYDYGTTTNNGNVLSQTITVPTSGSPLVFNQTYTYDSLNRLASATETNNTTQTWKQEFSYDRYGNRNFVTGSGHTTTMGSCPAAQCNPVLSTTNNRMSSGQGYSYDSAGNTTADPLSRTFVYDGENKQTSVSNSGGAIGMYSYDGDGKRVKKIDATGTMLFLYDAMGRLVEEAFSAVPPPCAKGDDCAIPLTVTTSYVYAGSRLLSTETSSGTTYMTADTLGTPRINTNGSGNVIARHDYQPFGEEIFTAQRTAAIGYAADTVKKKFTGYERDGETGLDFAEARMYSNTLGRFNTVDPLTITPERLIDPQRINLFSYVRNNPLAFIDFSGNDLVTSGTSGDQDIYKQALIDKANELKQDPWKLKRDSNGKLTFDGDAPTRPTDKALAQIYDALTTNTTNVNVSLVRGDSPSVGIPGDKTQTINLTNVDKLKESGIPGTSVSDTIFHETVEGINIQTGKQDFDTAHENALNDTKIGGRMDGSQASVIPSADGKNIVGIRIPGVYQKGLAKTPINVVQQLNPAFKLNKKENPFAADARLKGSVKDGSINLIFVGAERRY